MKVLEIPGLRQEEQAAKLGRNVRQVRRWAREFGHTRAVEQSAADARSLGAAVAQPRTSVSARTRHDVQTNALSRHSAILR
jgi:hypothetical protein